MLFAHFRREVSLQRRVQKNKYWFVCDVVGDVFRVLWLANYHLKQIECETSRRFLLTYIEIRELLEFFINLCGYSNIGKLRSFSYKLPLTFLPAKRVKVLFTHGIFFKKSILILGNILIMFCICTVIKRI